MNLIDKHIEEVKNLNVKLFTFLTNKSQINIILIARNLISMQHKQLVLKMFL